MTRAPYRITRPCGLCPFRSDVRAYLTPERVDEIDESLIRAEFPCHETTGVKTGKPDPRGEAHCAGALILLEKIERPSQMMRIGERLGMYDRRRLDMKAPVFDSFEDMREAQPDDHPKRSKHPKQKTAPRTRLRQQRKT